MADQQWNTIDEYIFAGRTLGAVKAIQDISKCNLQNAIYLLRDRYKDLRIAKPDGFSVSEGEYWNDCYS